MIRSRRLGVALVAAVSGAVLALTAAGPARADTGGPGPGQLSGPGQVYQVTNSTGGNAVQVYDRGPDGTLTARALVPTGGLGAGVSLGSQGAAVRAGGSLLVVNAGDDTLSSFTIRHGRPVLRDVEPTGGDLPVSVAVHDGLVYVLHAGSDTVTGLRLGRDGRLQPIQGSSRPLSGSSVGAAQVQFDNGGDRLVVTEKATNRILSYPVRRSGLLDRPTVTVSAGTTPFGFDIDARNRVVVSEAVTGTLSSYRFARGGLAVISGAVSDTQAAACWVEIVGRFAYTTNAASSTVSSFAIGRDGSLTLVAAVAATTGAGPTDIAASQDGRNLYVRTRSGSVDAFAVSRDGSLTGLGSVAGATSIGAAGLAAR